MSNAGYGNHDEPPPGHEPKQRPAADPARPGGKPHPDTPAKQDHVATPGDGAGAAGSQGGEVDPGTG